MRAIFILGFFLFSSPGHSQDEQVQEDRLGEDTEVLEPSNDVLIAASQIGNGRASLILANRFLDEDLNLAEYYATSAFVEGTAGAADMMLTIFELKEELIELQVNIRLGSMVLRAYEQLPDFAEDIPPSTSLQRLPHAAFTLNKLGQYDGPIPEVGEEIDDSMTLDIISAMHQSLQIPDIRNRVNAAISTIVGRINCDSVEKVCR